MRNLIVIGVLFVVTIGCDTADDSERRVTETLQAEGMRQAGVPNVINFQEKKLMKMIYELRDQENLVTYVYTQALDGKLVFLCKAIGYGLPYGTQYSNPTKIRAGGGSLPQCEPNGLFMPPTADATWIMALDSDGKPHPMFVEPRVIISTFPLHEIK